MIDEAKIMLGNTGIKVSPIGLGCMQWGGKTITSQGHEEAQQITGDIFEISLKMGINFFDTAEVYGSGESEKYLGLCTQSNPPSIVIATKFMPYPWKFTKGELRKSINDSLQRLRKTKIDLYQMHWPFPPVSINSWMDAMADAIKDGLIKAVGVSNYSPSQTRRAFERLQKYGIDLTSNQVKYNLLDRRAERNGLLALCKQLDIKVIAYSPLERGILTGKYSPTNIPTDFRSWRYNRTYLKKIDPLINELKNLGNKYGVKTPGQVALNWIVSKGAIPIPGAKNVAQAKENVGALGWALNEEEVLRLDVLSSQVDG